jgi:peroxiredoxin Q/BCP
MAQLRDEVPLFESQNAEILVVGPEGKAAFAKYFKENELPFVGLPDPSNSVLKLYGQEVKLFKLGRMPAMVIIDPLGNVRFAHYGKEMSDIPKNQDVLATLETINREGVG